MNRVELQEKLDTLLLGKPANYNYYIAHDVDKALSEWFDNSQGYYSMRADNYNFNICYKNRSLVTFSVKKQAHPEHRWVAREVVIEEDFDCTEIREQSIKQELASESDKAINQQYNRSNKDELVSALKLLKEHFPNKSAIDLKCLAHELEWFFWYVEEASLCN